MATDERLGDSATTRLATGARGTPAGVASGGRQAVVVNPSKFDELDAVKAAVARVCRDTGWKYLLWYRTSTEDPGEGQARDAIADGATIVCSLGGDGPNDSEG